MALAPGEVGRVARTPRVPQHPFHIHHRPFSITPFFFAPVLPGETMKNLMLQSRAVSYPIANPIIGWWLEHYFFYVKHRDLQEPLFLQMMLDPSTDLTSVDDDTAAPAWFHAGNGINWLKLCYAKIVANYFRDEGEAWDATTDASGYAVAYINQNSVWDSLQTDTQHWEGGADDPDVDDGDGIIRASEIQRALQLWEYAQMNNLTSMTYEDFLRSYGVKVENEERNVPELIRYSRDWTYPTNTVEPTTGEPSSAVSWAPSIRADKDRFFKEPGFVVGVTLARPKVYLGNHRGTVTSIMDRGLRWLPAIMRDDPTTSLVQIDTNSTDGVLSGGTAGYWFDIRDLFVYGEQFTNLDLATATGMNKVTLPNTTTMKSKYPTSTDVDSLFPGETKVVRQDGIVRMAVLGTQHDQTPRGSVLGMRM